MSAETDTSGEERVLRLLDDEGARWRAGYQPPSFDDAVRRLALPGDEASQLDAPHQVASPTAGRRIGWWRPALVAAAVLVLVGGLVGGAWHARRPETVPSGLADVGAAVTLTGLPDGFRAVDGPVANAQLGVGGKLAAAPLVERAWVSDRRTTGRFPMPESFIVRVWLGAGPEPYFNGPSVRSNPSQVSDEVVTTGPSTTATLVTVVWDEGDTLVEVSYTGPAPTSGSGRPLTSDEVLDVARSYRPTTVNVHPAGWSGSPRPVLVGTTPVVARLAQDGRHLLVSVDVNSEPDPARASTCHPYVQPVVTATDGRSVTVVVSVYAVQEVRAAGALETNGYACPPTATQRPVTVALDGPLGDRVVVDGTTGRVVLRGSA